MKINFNKLIKFSLAAFGIIIVCCIVSLITMLVGGVKPDLFEKSNTDNNTSGLSSRLDKTPDYGQNYINNIIFVGDSTTEAMKSCQVLNRGADTKQIWTGEGGTLSLDFSIDTATIVYPETAESISIATAAERKKPDYIIITLGIDNGVAYCTEAKFKEYYSKLLKSVSEVSPDTHIILQSVFPVSAKVQKESPNISNKKIDTANRWIEELAQDMSVRYLDTASVLKDSKGNLDPKYDSGDGICLNAEGYTAVLTYIRTHGYR